MFLKSLFLLSSLLSFIYVYCMTAENLILISSDNCRVEVPASFLNESEMLSHFVQEFGVEDPIQLPIECGTLEHLKKCIIEQNSLNGFSSFELESFPQAVAFLGIKKLENPLKSDLKKSFLQTFNQYHVLPPSIDIFNPSHHPLPPSFEQDIKQELQEEVLPYLQYFNYSTVFKFPKKDFYFKILFKDEDTVILFPSPETPFSPTSFHLPTKQIREYRNSDVYFWKIASHGDYTFVLYNQGSMHNAILHSFPVESYPYPDPNPRRIPLHYIPPKNLIILPLHPTGIRLFDLETGSLRDLKDPLAIGPLEHMNEIRNISSNAKGNIVGYYQAGKITFWNIEKDIIIHEFKGYNHLRIDCPIPFCLHPQQPLFAIIGPYKTIQLWNFLNSTLIQNISTQSMPALLAFSNSGKKLVMINQSGSHIEIHQTSFDENQKKDLKNTTLPQLIFLSSLITHRINKEKAILTLHNELYPWIRSKKTRSLNLSPYSPAIGNSLYTLISSESRKRMREEEEEQLQKAERNIKRIKEEIQVPQKQIPSALSVDTMMGTSYREIIFNTLPPSLKTYLLENKFVKN